MNQFVMKAKKRPRVDRICSSSNFYKSLRQYKKYRKKNYNTIISKEQFSLKVIF